MATPSGSAVLLGFAELNQTMNGPFIGTSGAPIVTIANVFAVSRLKDTDVPHHSRDTENYLNVTVNDLAEKIIKLVLPVLIVMSTALFSEPFSAVTEIPDTEVTVGLPSPLASTMASVPDWPKTRYACHGEPLTQMVDKTDEI